MYPVDLRELITNNSIPEFLLVRFQNRTKSLDDQGQEWDGLVFTKVMTRTKEGSISSREVRDRSDTSSRIDPTEVYKEVRNRKRKVKKFKV